jgi:hypothetical protein
LIPITAKIRVDHASALTARVVGTSSAFSGRMQNQELNEQELALVAGGMDMTNQETSTNVEDVRTPILTTGDFARYDRALDATNEYWSQFDNFPVDAGGGGGGSGKAHFSVSEY